MEYIIVQGIQYDEKSSFLTGPAQAPPIIRKTLHNGASNYYTESGTNIQTDKIIDVGDYEIKEYFEIEKVSMEHCREGRLLTLGGDHSITFPIVKAISNFHSDFQIIHIDAHSDLYDEFEGDKYSHACPFARIMEGGYANKLIQFGIRTLNAHQKEQAQKFGVDVHEMRHFNATEIGDIHDPVYISLDMDAFDPAFAPGVSHHEPGGLNVRQVMEILDRVKGPVIGADIVEFNPLRDNNQITASLTAKMTKEILGKMIENET